jgi:hypothetical protein
MPAKDPTKHKNAATWGKGKSGNPGGRSPRVGPNGETLCQLARAHTAEALAVLVEVANDKKQIAFARIQAASAILDRGWGKAKESVELDATVTSNAPVINLTVTRPAGDGA